MRTTLARSAFGCIAAICLVMHFSANGLAQPPKPPILLTPVIVTASDDPDHKLIDGIEKYPICRFNAQSGYRNGDNCLVQVYRDNPISPQPFVVPAGVHVYIELLNVRGNENILYVPTNTLFPPPDVGAAAVKNFIPGLQSFIAAQVTAVTPAAKAHVMSEMADIAPADLTLAQDLQARQAELSDEVRKSLQTVQGASTAMTCLSNYQSLPPLEGTPIVPTDRKPTKQACEAFKLPDGIQPLCSPAKLIPTQADFQTARFRMSCLATEASRASLPQFDLTNLDTAVKAYYQTCLSQLDNMGAGNDSQRKKCQAASDRLNSQEVSIDKTVTDIQAAQDTILQSQQTLDYWTSQPERIVYKVTSQSHVNVSVAISGTDVITKTSTTIATVAVNTTANKLVASVGIGFSNLKYHTFTASPSVSKVDTVPSVIAPVALLSYRLPYIGSSNTMNKCPGGCSVLMSAGAGANLTTKSADFDVGPSFQIGGVLITPSLHFGRDDRLTNGAFLGETFMSPPSSLPTGNSWVLKYAVLVTYSIPIP